MKFAVKEGCFGYSKAKTRMKSYISQSKEKYVAKYALLARGAGLSQSIPKEYRMPTWKAICTTLMDTIRVGGLKFIVVRVKQFFIRI